LIRTGGVQGRWENRGVIRRPNKREYSESTGTVMGGAKGLAVNLKVESQMDRKRSKRKIG